MAVFEQLTFEFGVQVGSDRLLRVRQGEEADHQVRWERLDVAQRGISILRAVPPSIGTTYPGLARVVTHVVHLHAALLVDFPLDRVLERFGRLDEPRQRGIEACKCQLICGSLV